MRKLYSLLPLAFAAALLTSVVSAQPWLKQSILSSASGNTEPAKESNFYDLQKKFNEYWKDKTPSKDEGENRKEGGYQQFKRWEAFMKPRVYPTGGSAKTFAAQLEPTLTAAHNVGHEPTAAFLPVLLLL